MARIGKNTEMHPVAKLINKYADELLKMLSEEKSKIGFDISPTPDEIIAINTLQLAICDKKTYREL